MLPVRRPEQGAGKPRVSHVHDSASDREENVETPCPNRKTKTPDPFVSAPPIKEIGFEGVFLTAFELAELEHSP